MDNDMEAIKETLDAMTPELRAAVAAKVKIEWEKIDEAGREQERQRKRDLLTAREDSALALIAAAESLKPLLVDFDRRNDALRQAIEITRVQPEHLSMALPGEIAGLNLAGARTQLLASRQFVEGLIDGK